MNKLEIDLDLMTPTAIRNEVIKRGMTHLTTMIPAFAGLVAFAAWFILDMGMVVLTTAITLLLLAPVVFAYHYFVRYLTIQNDYLEDLRLDAEFENEWKLQEMQLEFENADCEQAYDQVDMLIAKKEAFQEILGKRFTESELSYSRYNSVVMQTFNSAIYNLNEIVLKLKAIESIDVDEIEKQLNECYDECEEKALQERLDIHAGATDEINKLLKNNEKAMTEMDKFATMLANANVDNFEPEEELTKALDKISSLSIQTEEQFV